MTSYEISEIESKRRFSQECDALADEICTAINKYSRAHGAYILTVLLLEVIKGAPLSDRAEVRKKIIERISEEDLCAEKDITKN